MTTNEEFFNISLPKWPAMVVLGHAVTQEQAIEINFRTHDSYYSTNDRNHTHYLAELFGLEVSKYNNLIVTKEFNDKIGSLNLYYLANSNIASSYISGIHGWCSWDGEVFSNSYNIGKYPTVEYIYNEWRSIAQAFPFLNLTSQLFSGEVGEDSINPVIEFIVKNGKVKMKIPNSKLWEIHPGSWKALYAIEYEHLADSAITNYWEIFRKIRGI